MLNRRFHHAIHDMAHSRIMADTSRRMWDLSDFLINTSDVPQPFSAALDDRHADHERILAALHAGDQDDRARRDGEAHRRHGRRHPHRTLTPDAPLGRTGRSSEPMGRAGRSFKPGLGDDEQCPPTQAVGAGTGRH